MNLKLIIGLGNPDPEYQNTYHNVGYLFVRYLLEVRDVGVVRNEQIEQSASWPPARRGLWPGGRRSNISNAQLLESAAYMNKSGAFVAKALKKFSVKPEGLLIVHDDSDIELGKYKLSFGRGAAGHHGVESVQAALKTKDFWRLRIGIRPAADLADKTQTSQKTEKFRVGPRMKAGEFVLKKITATDKKILERVFEEIIENLK